MTPKNSINAILAPVIAGQTDTAPIYAAYERMRQTEVSQQTILVLVECQTVEEFREALPPDADSKVF